jgi:5-hydroxyisourate hydrolase
MPGISIHVVDVSRGVVAAGMKVELYAVQPNRRLLASGQTAANGQLEDRALAVRMTAGPYDAVFHVAAWYRAQQLSMPTIPFLDVVTYRFGISDPEQHYHLPFKCTPWGYSCFRGGA